MSSKGDVTGQKGSMINRSIINHSRIASKTVYRPVYLHLGSFGGRCRNTYRYVHHTWTWLETKIHPFTCHKSEASCSWRCFGWWRGADLATRRWGWHRLNRCPSLPTSPKYLVSRYCERPSQEVFVGPNTYWPRDLEDQGWDWWCCLCFLDDFLRILPWDSSPFNHHLGEYVLFLPTTFSKSKSWFGKILTGGHWSEALPWLLG